MRGWEVWRFGSLVASGVVGSGRGSRAGGFIGSRLYLGFIDLESRIAGTRRRAIQLGFPGAEVQHVSGDRPGCHADAASWTHLEASIVAGTT